jgi:uncharacterized protein HemX
MKGVYACNLALAAFLAIACSVWAQEPVSAPEAVSESASESESTADLEAKAERTLEAARETADAIAETVDESEQAREVSAGILQPIYRLAEALSFSAFHWVAFALMATGVVSFALQLTLGKLVVLTRAGFSPAEILGDALGLAVSLLGLVLTTQAAAENSGFTNSPAAVISATAVAVIVGIVFYVWGQRQELQAVEGRRAAAKKDKK